MCWWRLAQHVTRAAVVASFRSHQATFAPEELRRAGEYNIRLAGTKCSTGGRATLGFQVCAHKSLHLFCPSLARVFKYWTRRFCRFRLCCNQGHVLYAHACVQLKRCTVSLSHVHTNKNALQETRKHLGFVILLASVHLPATLVPHNSY